MVRDVASSHRANERGRRAELAVADYLVAQGFALIARNLRLGALELDVVAQRGGLVAVVEVRTRGGGSLEGPFESISPAKRARLLRAVDRLWRERLSGMSNVERVRIDAAAVTFAGGQTSVEYVAGAVSG
ncbi:MAG: YraN family protein [Myxococcota bacterium]|nr:YraN family protein [Myxococcota bacterium]